MELGDDGDENSSSSNRRKEKAFTGVGYTLGIFHHQFYESILKDYLSVQVMKQHHLDH